jgi:hypothetical protein
MNEARALVSAGILSREQGGALSGEAQSIVDQADGEMD